MRVVRTQRSFTAEPEESIDWQFSVDLTEVKQTYPIEGSNLFQVRGVCWFWEEKGEGSSLSLGSQDV